MDYTTGRALLQAAESSQDTAPFFGFIGAAAALVFSCEWHGLCRCAMAAKSPRDAPTAPQAAAALAGMRMGHDPAAAAGPGAL